MEIFHSINRGINEKFHAINFPTVNTCCCCVDLRTAGLLLGGLSAAGYILSIVLENCVIWSGE